VPGLTPEQIDVWEVHEAFSAQALGVLRELPNQLAGFTIPDEKLTLDGGAMAIGHPFGATGTRYVLTLATALRERNARYGSGQGVASFWRTLTRAHGAAARQRSDYLVRRSQANLHRCLLGWAGQAHRHGLIAKRVAPVRQEPNNC
jgi:hypothetical protein